MFKQFTNALFNYVKEFPIMSLIWLISSITIIAIELNK